ncbi:immp-2 [Pristionchus pacificus]|uniref:Mitochondrial inner membrane protease subunit 2 n=1 Tax=Pristionchus pacificus TaxID=54126 RepID=A0A2A6BYN7_PRIPA|nr:immp-2 [Pristionchus pacificus]|eukprot:PDM71010.1 immp-2 [Pristionchus pacificus]
MLLRALGRLTLGGCVVVTFFDRIGHPACIQGSSMYPTLDGSSHSLWGRDIVWLSTLSINNPTVGNIYTFIYTFRSPRDPDRVLIKRVTAVEGSLVRRKPNSELFIVPEGSCWLTSDNETEDFSDSQNFGPVSYGLVKGRATHIIWPPSRWRSIK